MRFMRFASFQTAPLGEHLVTSVRMMVPISNDLMVAV